MNVGEILDLTVKGVSMQKLSKEYVEMGHNQIRKALVKAGCAYNKEKRRWEYVGNDSTVLKQSIYDFAIARMLRNADNEVVATVENGEEGSPFSQLSEVVENNQDVQPTNKKINNPIGKKSNQIESKQVIKQEDNPTIKEVVKPIMKKVTYEIEESLHDKLRIKAIVEKRTVSDIVNDIIKRGIGKDGY